MKLKVIVLAVVASMLLGCAEEGKGAGPTAAAQAAPAPAGAEPEREPPVAFAESLSPEVYSSPEEAAAAAEAAVAEAEAAAGFPSAEPAAPPVRVSLQDKSGPAYSVITYLVVQSTADEVTIGSVDVNRGNCAVLSAAGKEVEFPVTLVFGRELWLQPVMCGGILEAEVHTSLGDHAFSFNGNG